MRSLRRSVALALLLLVTAGAGGCREQKTKEQRYAESEQQILKKMQQLRERQQQITVKLADLEERLEKVREKLRYYRHRWDEPTPTPES